MRRFPAGLAVCSLLLMTSLLPADDKRDPTVGAAGFIEQIILPGSELVGKPIDDRSPIVVRVVQVFSHGDSFRYDLQFHGLEPGKYNLSDWLERKDGSASEGLPTIDVEIKSLLPPGQIEPNALERGWLPRLGGYRVIASVVIVLWVAVLLGLIFLGRKKTEHQVETEKALTLADLLKPRLQAAMENRLNPEQHAELERMLFAFWRKRMNLDSVAPEQALAEIHNDSEAGPLMKQLEHWMHNPSSSNREVELSELLQPYQELPAEMMSFDT